MPYLGELIFCESFCKLQRLFAITQRHFRVASWVKRRNLGASMECLCNTFDCFFPRRRMKLAVIQELISRGVLARQTLDRRLDPVKKRL